MEEYFAEHNITKKRAVVFTTSLLIAVFILAFRVSLVFSNMTSGIYFLFNGLNQETIIMILNILLLVSGVVLILSSCVKKRIKIIVTAACILLLAANIISFRLFYENPKFFYFRSPGENITIVAEEKAWLNNGTVSFYKEGFVYAKRLNSVKTSNSFRPFTNNDYKLTWIDSSTLKITYGFGNADLHNEIILNAGK